MKQRLVRGAFLGLLLLPSGGQAAHAAAGDTELNAADAKRAAGCEGNRIATIEVPAGCGIHFVVQRLGGEESAFSMQYTKPPQWLTDGSPTNAFWPPADGGYHTYQSQTAGAFQPRPSGPFQVRVIGMWKWPGEGAPSTRAQVIDAKKKLFCMSRVNRVTSDDRVVLNFFAGADDPRPSAGVQAVLDGGSPSQKCRK